MWSSLRLAAETLAPVSVLDFWAGRIDASWSVDRPLARVVARHAAAANAVTLVLRPNRNWKGFEPGQHVNLTVEVDGRRRTRSYSPARATDRRGCIAITVKQVPGGLVSSHLCRTLAVGDVVELGPAYGDMRVPPQVEDARLFLAAGSGITPLMAMTRELAARGMPRPLTLFYWSRTRDELCFADELRELARRHPDFRVRFVLTREAALLDDELEGRLGPATLAALGEPSGSATFACGPADFVETCRAHLASRTRSFAAESFSPPALNTRDTGRVRVRLAKSGRTLEVARGQPLLAALEEQGVQPAYGCRMGICNTCACEKRSGATTHLRTGAVEAEPASALRLCVNAATTDLVIDL